jgi:diacylglycerol kinase (ATP)
VEKTKRAREKISSATQYFLKHQRSLLESFNWAIEGLSFGVRTQRNLKLHFLAATLAVLLTLALGLEKWEIVAVLIVIGMVITAELFNTAIEVAVDLATDGKYKELAKIAKDVAAAGVLVAASTSVFVGYLIFFKRLNRLSLSLIQRLVQMPEYLTGIALFLVVTVAIVFKVVIGEGTPGRGGWPSIHAALAGSLFTSITILSKNFLISSLSLILALLVLQARVEKAIHTTFEVVSGFLLGIFLTLFLFQLFYF